MNIRETRRFLRNVYEFEKAPNFFCHFAVRKFSSLTSIVTQAQTSRSTPIYTIFIIRGMYQVFGSHDVRE